MARNFTVAQLTTRVQQLVDIESDTNVASTEIYSKLSAAYGKYYAKLVRAGFTPARTTATITADGATQAFAVPADHLTTLRIDYQYSSSNGGQWYPLDELDVREIHLLPYSGSWACGYLFAGSNIELYPLPAAGSYRHIYIPAAADLTASGNSIDGISGYERALVLEAAIEVLIKQNRPEVLAVLVQERASIDAELDEMIKLRSLTSHRRVVRKSPLWDPYSTSRRMFDPSDWPPWTR